MEIAQIKQLLSIQTVLSHYGLAVDKNGMLLCPFHADKNPSLKIYDATNSFNCFGCGRNGDQLELCAQMEGSKHKGLLKATELVTLNPEPKARMVTEADTLPSLGTEEEIRIHGKLFDVFKKGLQSPISKRAKEYLQERGLDYTLLEIGYNSGQFHQRGGISDADKAACIAAGLLIPYTRNVPNATGSTYTPFAKDCIIFPLRDKDNNIVNFYGRSIINHDKEGKHHYQKGRHGLYPAYPNPHTERLFIAESVIDAASLQQITAKLNELRQTPPPVTSILASYGTNGITPEHTEAIKALPNLKRVVFFFDGDKAGRMATAYYCQKLSEELPHVSFYDAQLPDEEDVNSFTTAHEPEAIYYLAEQAQKVERKISDPTVAEGFPQPETYRPQPKPYDPKPNYQPVQVQQVNESEIVGVETEFAETEETLIQLEEEIPQVGDNCLNTSNPDYITYVTEELQIALLGGVSLQQLDKLRVTLKISKRFSDRIGKVPCLRQNLDLYQGDYLDRFVGRVCDQLEISSSVLKRTLTDLTELLEEYRMKKIESLKTPKAKKRELTEARHLRVTRYLQSPGLMQRTGEDIGRAGVIGEETNRLLMFLVFTSRLREHPLHIVSLGASGTGKTYLQEKVSALIPESDKIEITILSENAFYYFGRTELKHKLVLIEDMDGAMDVLYPLRELQTKEIISKTVPVKDSKGELQTMTRFVEGPICMAGTTTMERLYEDNANRSLLIYLDNSPRHREAIMDYQRRLSAGKIDAKKEKEVKEFFKDLQSVLRPVKVRNPYAEFLKLPEYVFKPLRTNAHYLAVIETITFYHQFQREVFIDPLSGEEYIETTLEDIEWANVLLKDVLLAKSDELSKAVRDFFEDLKTWLKKERKESFYTRDVQERLRMYPMKISRYLYELESRNFVRKVRGNRKTGFEYEINRWDDYLKLQSGTKLLDDILDQIRNKSMCLTNE